MYRPYYYDRIAAGLDEHGMPIAWTHRIAGSWIMGRVINQLFPKTLRVMRAAGLRQLVAMVKGLDVDAVEGAAGGERGGAIEGLRGNAGSTERRGHGIGQGHCRGKEQGFPV